MSLPPSLDRLRAGLASGAGVSIVSGRPGLGGPTRRAAVLILAFQDGPLSASGPDGLSVVLVEKSAHLHSHAGQLAFPGGGVERTDATDVDAALREAEEEVGVDPEGVQVLGELPPAHIAVSGFDVAPVVGWWERPYPLAPRDTFEIAAVHDVAVTDLVAPENRGTWTLSGFVGPAFVVGDLFVWGFTAHLLDGLLDLAGWSEPWDQRRRLSIPHRFLRGRPDTGQ